MKEIVNVTSDGITYIDEEGKQVFIDFESCHKNNLIEKTKRIDSKHIDEEIEFWQKAKYVGIRFALSDPLAIEFYTEPRILFEFPTRESFSELLLAIKKAGWRTNDGE